MDMIERVALAIYRGQHTPTAVQLPIPDYHNIREECIDMARAAITAMIEPTEEMLEAISHTVLARVQKTEGHTSPLPWEDGYRIMIEAALGSPQYVVTEDAPERIKEMIPGKG